MSVMSIRHNTAHMNAHRNMGVAKAAHESSMHRLTTGHRVNGATDDAAGLSTSAVFQAQVRGLAAGTRSADEARNILRIAEGGMGEVSDMLQRMREIAVQATSESITTRELENLELEYVDLRDNIDRVGKNTKYNGELLMDGNYKSKSMNVGSDSGSTNRVSISIDRIDSLFIGVSFTHLENEMFANAAIVQIDKAIDKVNSGRANMNAQMKQLEAASRHSQTMLANMSASGSDVRDADVAAETSNMSRAQIRMQASASMLSQANIASNAALRLMQ